MISLFLIPTFWNKDYILEINKMKDYYFSKNLNNILLLTNKNKSFDTSLKGDFNLESNLLKRVKIIILFILVANFE